MQSSVAEHEHSSKALWFWAFWSVIAAFGTYFCMYAFRKPFTAATFDEVTLWGLTFKTLLVSSQTIGYAISKFIGVKVIAEMVPQRRAIAILVLILIAHISLLLFAIVPRPWNAICLFLNGLPLGMVFGLVLGFLEGRRVTEVLTAGLCASFILADGVTKSLGSKLLQWGVTPEWMPFWAGLIFILPVVVFVAMLAVIPPPTKSDVLVRSERAPLTREERWGLYGRYWFGLNLLVAMYLLITVLRSIRADFAPELWKGLGEVAAPSQFTQSEIWVALGVLIVTAATVLIKNNRAAFFTSLGVCLSGIALLLVTLLVHQFRGMSALPFMALIGLGLYLPYVAVHTTLFERLIAMTRERGNVGFLMYVADSIGYLGYIAVMVYKNYHSKGSDFLGFFIIFCWISIILSAIFIIAGWIYFVLRCPENKKLEGASETSA